MRDDNIRHLKKTERFNRNEAIDWFEQFGAKGGQYSNDGTKNTWYWYYTPPSLLIFVFPGFEGGMYYSHVIKMHHFASWETPAFVLGMDDFIPGSRKENPFHESDFYSRDAWESGRSLALNGFTIESFLAMFKTNHQ